MLASRVFFEQSPEELTKSERFLFDRVSPVNNIALHGADDITITIHDITSPERSKLEEFIKNLFKCAHGANIQSFMPQLMALSGQNGKLMAVCGLRKADQGPLFLERYLSSSIEETLSDRKSVV
jgi:hypothetical protein